MERAEMALPKFEDWQAPWEKHDEEFDPEKGKKFLYSLLEREEKAKAGEAEAVKTRDEAVAQRDALQKQVEDKSREGESEADRLKREKAELEQRLADAEKPKGDPVEVLRLQVALDKGLTLVQSKRLLGSTKEELEQDADELLASFGGKGSGPDDEDDDAQTVRTRPRAVRRNSLDPDPDAGRFDVDKAVDQIPRP